jgi:hypothetical protein
VAPDKARWCGRRRQRAGRPPGAARFARPAARRELVEAVGERIDGWLPDEEPRGPRRRSIELAQVGERDLRAGSGLSSSAGWAASRAAIAAPATRAGPAAPASGSRRIAPRCRRSASPSWRSRARRVGVRHGGLGERADRREHAGVQSVTGVKNRPRRIDHGLGDRVRDCASGRAWPRRAPARRAATAGPHSRRSARRTRCGSARRWRCRRRARDRAGSASHARSSRRSGPALQPAPRRVTRVR